MATSTHPLSSNFVLPGRSRKVRVSLFASLTLGLAFNASMLSVVGTKIGIFPSSIGNAIAAGALLVLIIMNLFRSKRFSLSSLPTELNFSAIFLCATTLCLGLYGFTSPDTPDYLKMSVLLKTAGVLITVFALASSCQYFNYKEIALALKIFAIVELLGCIALFRFYSDDINPNTIAVRATVASMCLFALLRTRTMKLLAITGCLAFSAMLGCRTSAVAAVGSLTFLYLERHSRRQREVVLIVCVTGFVLALLALPSILAALHQLAYQNLGSDNPIARFFLHDKTSAKLSHDYLDRTEIWTQSWEFIKEKPFLGWGLGTEKDTMGARSHNAYLSMVFEGGAVFFLAWMWFYVRTISSFFDRGWLSIVGQSELFYLATILLSYMLLAGLVESSGLSSVSTPINLIFIFLTFWLFQPNRNPHSRSFTGA